MADAWGASRAGASRAAGARRPEASVFEAGEQGKNGMLLYGRGEEDGRRGSAVEESPDSIEQGARRKPGSGDR